MAPIVRKRHSGRCLRCGHTLRRDAVLADVLAGMRERAQDHELMRLHPWSSGFQGAALDLAVAHLRGYCTASCEAAAQQQARHWLLRRLVFVGLLHCELRPEVAHAGGQS